MQAIFNQPPSIAEDAIHYVLHPTNALSDRMSATGLALSVQSFVDALLRDFIWHRDQFQLKVVRDEETSGWVLEGRMRVGDSIDDEWCVVWLLREISSKWDFAISVRDSDGEFVLIEAADALPSWVTPSVVENRVWIHNYHLHLIPLSHVSPPSSRRRRHKAGGDDDDSGETEDHLDISDALKLVRDASVDTQAPRSVEQTVWQRISRYPDALSHHVHKAKAYLPKDISKALSVDPGLVQKAAEAFYTRDAAQLRAVHKMSRFHPTPCILQAVRLTRTAYAQLVGQKFYPPKVFGHWQEKEGTPEWRWKDLGMKISCGFEMLYQEGGPRSEPANASANGLNAAVQARREALQRDPEYAKYISNIQTAGYFRDQIKGSQLWNELETKAMEVFIQSRRDDDASRPSFAYQVNAALANAGDLEPSQDDEDSDDWLNVNAEDFDDFLQQKMAQGAQSADNATDVDRSPQPENEEDRIANAQVAKLRDLASKVDAFVAGQGDVEGAMFEEEQSSGEEADELSDEKFSDSDDSDRDDDSAKAARADAMENLVPGIDPSEYGRMPPSFHDHSQRVAPATLGSEVVEADTEKSDAGAGADHLLPQSKPMRPPILPRDQYEGVDSDDTDDEDAAVLDDDEEEEDQPQVVGEVEVDMAEEEEEFLEFSRQALGISDEHWREIIRERKSRGAFVPAHVVTESHAPATKATAPDRITSSGLPKSDHSPSTSGPQAKNPNLNSFEAVMKAMDEELARSKSKGQRQGSSSLSSEGKGKQKAPAQDAETMDIEHAMDAELKAALDHDEDDDVDLDAEGGMDYNLIKNFLESFKSQAGLSGPVSNLAGRLQPGWGLPRDES
ncbi:SGT1 protein-domain-containing protein [Gloeopeniophorella convolvens]|nr:SGT1 protein-domain-containing protein [Gloeopeniophorella convolvens]